MPFDGEIVEVRDGYPERSRVVPIREIAIVLKNAFTFDIQGDLAPVVGNHVIARSDDVFAAFAHLAPGTVAVSKGEAVSVGDVIGRVVIPAIRPHRTCTSSSWTARIRVPRRACHALSGSSRSRGATDGSVSRTRSRDDRTASERVPKCPDVRPGSGGRPAVDVVSRQLIGNLGDPVAL